MKRRISILGSTGSIGCSTLKVLESNAAHFEVKALTAAENVDALIAQARRWKPAYVAIGNEAHYEKLKEALADISCEVAAGVETVCEAARKDADMVVSAIVGAAGLKPTLAAIENGTAVALANKECLVAAGTLVMEAVAKHGTPLIPVDSEHSAIFQLLHGRDLQGIERITLTASGGPFRDLPISAMRDVSPEAAVKHPNWSMGAKISVDSATLMNKGLELIEAHHLFNVPPDSLDVLVHPESIIHGLVYYRDGSVLAQMSMPDMCTPIAYALGWPERIPAPCARLDLAAMGSLSFAEPDTNRFPALTLARAAMEAGSAACCVLNAANEMAVHAFLSRHIGFLDIVSVVENACAALSYAQIRTISDVEALDAEARRHASLYIHRKIAEAA